MSETIHVVVIEDEAANRESYERALSKIGYRVAAFSEAESAFRHLRGHRDVILVITDLMMPGTDGFGVLAVAREIDPEIGILMITGHGSVESAVDAMKRGADDYLTKPVDLFELRKRASAIVEKRLLSRRVVELESRLGEKFGKLISRSKPMEALFRQMEMVAPTRSNVLIVGESGTGKELVANALHENSPRKDARFLPINCAAIPSEILESELFGHERGPSPGRPVARSNGSPTWTLFLDEVGELPLEMQVKLLRVLETREFMRVGGTETIKVDIRLVAATNSDLEAAVERGAFRNDLYYRLKVVTLRIPPLRERREDIPLLANHFLAIFAKENDRDGMKFAPDALRAIVSARWEGNVRELRNLVESLVVLTPDGNRPRIFRKSSPIRAGLRGAGGRASSGAGQVHPLMDEIEAGHLDALTALAESHPGAGCWESASHAREAEGHKLRGRSRVVTVPSGNPAGNWSRRQIGEAGHAGGRIARFRVP
jgi:DNA-binding NtrC family response regulator